MPVGASSTAWCLGSPESSSPLSLLLHNYVGTLFCQCQTDLSLPSPLSSLPKSSIAVLCLKPPRHQLLPPSGQSNHLPLIVCFFVVRLKNKKFPVDLHSNKVHCLRQTLRSFRTSKSMSPGGNAPTLGCQDPSHSINNQPYKE